MVIGCCIKDWVLTRGLLMFSRTDMKIMYSHLIVKARQKSHRHAAISILKSRFKYVLKILLFSAKIFEKKLITENYAVFYGN